MVNFFTQDDWPFTKIQGEPILQMAFQGENGKWTCYAKARVEQEQFVFYSVCPVNAPENKRLAVAEFLTLANSGMIIGNFELDFTDGKIRYKTSIDVEGDSLSFALIKKLVYANVTMMDEYLPGIIAAIKGNVSAKDAIAQIEGQLAWGFLRRGSGIACEFSLRERRSLFEVLQQNIATNGQHQGIAVEIQGEELVFDNIEHQGITRKTWINNLYCPIKDAGGDFEITEIDF